MPISPPLPALTLALLLTIPACTVRNASKLQHDEGVFLPHSSGSCRWVAPSRDAFTTRESFYNRFLSFTADDQPLAVHLNTWVEQMHRHLQNTVPGLSEVPAPRIIVAQVAYPDARVTPFDVCLPVAVTARGPGSDASNAVYLSVPDGGAWQATSFTPGCAAPSGDSNSQRQWLTSILSAHANCLRIDGPSGQIPSLQVDLDVACAGVPLLAKAEQVLYPATATYIVFNQAVGHLAEDEAASLLAHELAHYYRAHPSVSAKDYFFFYHLGQAMTRPQPLAAQDPLAQLGAQILADHSYPPRADLLQQAAAAGLGYYTKEQEADELGLEIAVRFGLPPDAAERAYLALLKADYTGRAGRPPDVPGVLDYPECAKALATGFPGGVPVGDFRDSHHAACYRVYNVHREAAVHADFYTKLTKSPLRLDPAHWRDVQAEVPAP